MKRMILGLLIVVGGVGLAVADPSFQRVGIFNTLSAWVNPSTEDGLTAIRLSLTGSFVTQTHSLAAAGTSIPLTLVKPTNNYSFQVGGVADTLDVWHAELQGSVDGVNYSTLIKHTVLVDTDNVVLWTADKPVIFLRSKMIMITLGGATGAKMHLLGK